VTLGVCVCVRRATTARRFNLGGEGNVLYPVLSSYNFLLTRCRTDRENNRHETHKWLSATWRLSFQHEHTGQHIHSLSFFGSYTKPHFGTIKRIPVQRVTAFYDELNKLSIKLMSASQWSIYGSLASIVCFITSLKLTKSMCKRAPHGVRS